MAGDDSDCSEPEGLSPPARDVSKEKKVSENGLDENLFRPLSELKEAAAHF